MRALGGATSLCSQVKAWGCHSDTLTGLRVCSKYATLTTVSNTATLWLSYLLHACIMWRYVAPLSDAGVGFPKLHFNRVAGAVKTPQINNNEQFCDTRILVLTLCVLRVALRDSDGQGRRGDPKVTLKLDCTCGPNTRNWRLCAIQLHSGYRTYFVRASCGAMSLRSPVKAWRS